MASVDQPLKEVAPLLAAVAIVSMTTATLRLKLETWLRAGSDLKPPSSAVAKRVPDAASPIVDDLSTAAIAGTSVVATKPQAASPSSIGDLAPLAVNASATSSRPAETEPLAAAVINITAMAKRPHELTLPVTAMSSEEPDLASSTAAAARAKALVEQSVGIPNARILKPVIAKRQRR